MTGKNILYHNSGIKFKICFLHINNLFKKDYFRLRFFLDNLCWYFAEKKYLFFPNWVVLIITDFLRGRRVFEDEPHLTRGKTSSITINTRIIFFMQLI